MRAVACPDPGAALCNGETERTRMLKARHSFVLLWHRLVAALSLLMAAALAPAAVSAPAGGAGAGAIGPRMGGGAAVASAANPLAGNAIALVDGEQQQLPLGMSTDGTKAKACTVNVWRATALRPGVVCPPRIVAAAPPTHAARSGPARAPPSA
jgi:hypothetical protein